jgi:hypothetical protein
MRDTGGGEEIAGGAKGGAGEIVAGGETGAGNAGGGETGAGLVEGGAGAECMFSTKLIRQVGTGKLFNHMVIVFARPPM